MAKLIYCATPSRISGRTTDIMDAVTSSGNAPLHPFQALPFERFEGNERVGRERSMEFCMRLVDISDEVWMFGVSKGTMEEAAHARKTGKPVRLAFEGFDPDWKEWYAKLGADHGWPLEGLVQRPGPDAVARR